MKKLLTITMLFVFVCGLCSACKKNALPPELTETAGTAELQVSPYANQEKQKGPYMTNEEYSAIVYGDRMYYSNENCVIQYIQLGELKSDLRTIKKVGDIISPTVYSPCPDPVCSHINFDCPSFLHDPDAKFLIDYEESNGELPVIYFFRCTAGIIEFEDPWAADQAYEIVRYDTGMNSLTQIALVEVPIKQMMVYNDNIYFVTQTAKDSFELNRVSKSGGTVVTLSLGDCYLNLIGATTKGVYLNDEKGNIFEVDLLASESNIIFHVEEAYSFYPNRPARFNFFIEEDYLYYYDDFVAEDATEVWGKDAYAFRHTIRRIDLNNPMDEGELVVSDVIEDLVYGVYDGVLYYAPYELVGIDTEKYTRYAYSNGRISAVRLDTLEYYDVVSDCGLSFGRAPCYVTNRCIIETARPYREGFWLDRNTCGYYTCLYDFKTGALYIVGSSVI